MAPASASSPPAPLARLSDVLAPLVLLGGAGADRRQARRPRLGVERPRGGAPVRRAAQRRPGGVGGGDRRLAPAPRERQRAARAHLADPRRRDLTALREVAEALCRRARVEPV